MLATIARRVGVFAASLLASTVVVFAFMVLLPGDPARVALGVNASDDAVRALRHGYGLDRPLPVQYLDWLRSLVTGDLGESYISHARIAPLVLDHLLVTGWLVVVSMALAVALAIPTGALMAATHRRPIGAVISALSQIGVAVPGFLAGIVLVTIFAVRLRWLPANGWTPPAVDPGQFLRQLVLPCLALGLVQAAVLSRYVRSAVLEVMHQDYLRTARAKGLRPVQALVRHGLRNAAVPVITVLGLQLSTLLVGAVVIERVFVIPGLGSLLLDAVGTRDLLVVQDVVMVLVVAVLLVGLLVDLLYVVVDPRLRSAAR